MCLNLMIILTIKGFLLSFIFMLKATTEEDIKQNFTTSMVNLLLPIVNFPFISNNIPALQAYGVYISQLIVYAKLSAFLDRAQLLMQS